MNEIKKVSKLTDEMTTFYLENGARDIKIEVRVRQEGIYIVTSGRGIKMSDQELKEIEKNINTRNREIEMEEYYWSLVGEGPSSEELSLVAVMVDTAGVTRDRSTDTVTINLFRKA